MPTSRELPSCPILAALLLKVSPLDVLQRRLAKIRPADRDDARQEAVLALLELPPGASLETKLRAVMAAIERTRYRPGSRQRYSTESGVKDERGRRARLRPTHVGAATAERHDAQDPTLEAAHREHAQERKEAEIPEPLRDPFKFVWDRPGSSVREIQEEFPHVSRSQAKRLMQDVRDLALDAVREDTLQQPVPVLPEGATGGAPSSDSDDAAGYEGVTYLRFGRCR